MLMPTCCGKRMRFGIETPKFVEAWCRTCNDRVFVKKEEAWKPEMLDD